MEAESEVWKYVVAVPDARYSLRFTNKGKHFGGLEPNEPAVVQVRPVPAAVCYGGDTHLLHQFDSLVYC
jgi:hypothetical protein